MIRIAKALNRFWRRPIGTVFADRYFALALRKRAQAWRVALRAEQRPQARNVVGEGPARSVLVGPLVPPLDGERRDQASAAPSAGRALADPRALLPRSDPARRPARAASARLRRDARNTARRIRDSTSSSARAGLPGVSRAGQSDPPRLSRSVAVWIARRKAPAGLGRSARRRTPSRAVAGGSLSWSRTRAGPQEAPPERHVALCELLVHHRNADDGSVSIHPFHTRSAPRIQRPRPPQATTRMRSCSTRPGPARNDS